jgi:FAD/FMN-containing dehydrogenase
MGNGYSWAPHVLTRDVCLRLVGLNRILGVNRDNKTVRVQAGVRLGDLTRSLAAHGLTLPSLSFVSDATVGGVVATASHGTSAKWGTLSDSVVSMTLVLSTGEIKTVGPGDASEELRAAKVAVGMLGVIVEVELQAIDMPWVRYSERTMDLSTFLASRSAILTQYDHVWAHWTLGHDKVLLKLLQVRDTPARGFQPYVTDDNAYWQHRQILGRATRKLQRIARRFAAPLTSLVERLAERQQTADPRQVWMSMQYGVLTSQAEGTIDHIRASEFAKQHSGRVVELKFLKGTDDTYLGPNAGGDALLFNIWWLVDDHVKFTIFEAFETMMRTLHARPHWGKLHASPDVGYMQTAYPHWAQFEAVRSRFDPSGTFSIFGPKQVQDTPT